MDRGEVLETLDDLKPYISVRQDEGFAQPPIVSRKCEEGMNAKLRFRETDVKRFEWMHNPRGCLLA